MQGGQNAMRSMRTMRPGRDSNRVSTLKQCPLSPHLEARCGRAAASTSEGRAGWIPDHWPAASGRRPQAQHCIRYTPTTARISSPPDFASNIRDRAYNRDQAAHDLPDEIGPCNDQVILRIERLDWIRARSLCADDYFAVEVSDLLSPGAFHHHMEKD